MSDEIQRVVLRQQNEFNRIWQNILKDDIKIETLRLTMLVDNEIEDFDHETTTKKQNRGNEKGIIKEWFKRLYVV